jgi:F-type H+-transporting ATPase subunit b
MKRSILAAPLRGLSRVMLAFMFAAGAAPHAALAYEEPSGAAASGKAAAHGEHASEGHASGEHEEGEATFNWAYGFLGEKEGVPPGLVYRPKGMAPPFLANVLNALVLFTIIVAAGRKPIALGLRKRKERIVHGMEEAGRMKTEASARLAEYEEKLKQIEREIERIRTEMREAAESERRRVLQEAKERRDRMEKDARLLVEQESKAAREKLARETIAAAVRSAEEIITRSIGPADRDRMITEYFETLDRASLGRHSGARS